MSGFFNSLKNFASGAAYAASSASKYEELEVEDTKMRFSLTPQPGESSFTQWLEAMKMVARLQGGIPPEFRKRLWLTLAERHLEQRGVDWKEAEKVCFNEWSNPDDEELGIQIVKDLHRTGCSLFCGAAGRDNQAVLRRVLLGFARWNKSVGYCQGLNVLAALVLQVMDRAESSAVKVMIYLIEGVLPEAYFADNLRGLSVDMAVFRDLLRGRLPKLSKHLEALQSEAKDKATGSSYEPPLTNVFTMQWFLTLFCHCLPQEAVLRVWDLIFLEGDEVLLRTALTIWEGLSDRIMTVTSADEFYSIMGVLTREMLECTDTNSLIKNIVSMGALHGVTSLREKHRYNITPWARKLSDDEDSDTEEDERLAVAAAMFSVAQRLKKGRIPSTVGALQAMAPNSDRERLVLDISTLKQQYAKLRERQRQAHIILSAACARQSMVPPPTSQAMNHLLVGKNALVSAKSRPLSLPSGNTPSKTRPSAIHSPRGQHRTDRQGVTLHWKDTKRSRQKSTDSSDVAESSGASLQSPQETLASLPSPKRSNADSDSDSTSTELCDEPDRMSDVDSEELTSASESYAMATDDEKNARIDNRQREENVSGNTLGTLGEESRGRAAVVGDTNERKLRVEGERLGEISIANITDQIRRLSAEDDNKMVVPHASSTREEKSVEDLPLGGTSLTDETAAPESTTNYGSKADAGKKSLDRGSYDSKADAVKKPLDLDGYDSKADVVKKSVELGSNDSQADTVKKPLDLGSYDSKADTVKKPLDLCSYNSKTDAVKKPLDLGSYDSKTDAVKKPSDQGSYDSKAEAVKKPSDLDGYDSKADAVKKSLDLGSYNSKTDAVKKPLDLGSYDSKADAVKKPLDLGSYDSKTDAVKKPSDLDSYDSKADAVKKPLDLGSYDSKTDAVKKPLDLGSYDSKADAAKKPLDLGSYDSKTDAVKKPLDLGSYDYFGYGGSMVDAKEDQVLVHGRHRLKDTKEEMEKTILNDTSETKRERQDGTCRNIRRDSIDAFSNYSSHTLETKYDKIVTAPKADKAKRYESTFNFFSDISTSVKTYESERVDSSINDPLDGMTSERPFPTKTYVVGHLPISPITVDEKLAKMTNATSGVNSIGGLAQETRTNPEMTLERSAYSDRTQTLQRRSYTDTKRSPKTPESTKSFSSGETMGPDSKPSSLTVSPRTPVRSESRDFSIDKSACSSVSSDSKTLILRSVESDVMRDISRTDTKRTSYEKSSSSTPISTDSLRNKSEISPKLVVSSSSGSCSPRLKSSERSFSSDLQSPISANSIKFTSGYGKRGQENVSDSPIDLGAATSPFYPISHPNQKGPSPYNAARRRYSIDSAETSPEQKSSSSRESSKYLGYPTKYEATLKPGETREVEVRLRKNGGYVRSEFSGERGDTGTSSIKEDHHQKEFEAYQANKDYYRGSEDFADDNADDPPSEKDVVPSLPHEAMEKHYLNYNYRHGDRSRRLERSSSSLERRFANLKSSASTDELAASMAKKRSSDILEDIKHLEAKVMNDGSSDSGILTKKTSYIWEDLKNLEARRQDTFSNSAKNFSKRRLEIPEINVTSEGRKSYIVHPRMNIDENSESILKTMSRSKEQGDADDGRESKLGVWTKVKPRKKGNDGRRNSDRALKIIQENSAILHKILACQAKKRLPDLEEISKEITISPINEEISKIFSPILEKMGLDEREINEELARINFKDFDSMTATSVSEFDAKINDELSKLSLIDDNEEMDHLDIDEITSQDYLERREALIDRKINEELSKLLANYESTSPVSMLNLDKGSSSQNVSEIEGLDLTSISTNVFSYKSSNDSIETRSDLGSTREPGITTDKYPQYTENILPYVVPKYHEHDLSPSSDMDIYRELEKLDKISSAQVLPDLSLEIPQTQLSPIHYVSNTLPYPTYSSKSGLYDTSPLKSSYDPYKTFEFKSTLSPRRTPSNPYTPVPYEKSVKDTSFDYIDHKSVISSNAYDLHPKSPMLTKESLEFRVRYDDDTPRQVSSDYLSTRTDGRSTIGSSKVSPYYSNGSGNPITPTKYVPKEERGLDAAGSSFLEYTGETSDLLYRKYDPLSPKKYSHGRATEYDRHLGSTLSSTDPDVRSYLPSRHREYHTKSPSRQFDEPHFPSSINHYTSKFSPGLADESKRPVSHPEFPGNLSVAKYTDMTDIEVEGHKKSSLSLGNVGHPSKDAQDDYGSVTSPKTQFSPFPVRNVPRKPKELTLKLGLYSSKSSDIGQLKRS